MTSWEGASRLEARGVRLPLAAGRGWHTHARGARGGFPPDWSIGPTWPTAARPRAARRVRLAALLHASSPVARCLPCHRGVLAGPQSDNGTIVGLLPGNVVARSARPRLWDRLREGWPVRWRGPGLAESGTHWDANASGSSVRAPSSRRVRRQDSRPVGRE
jgi:hypothetical protein